MRHLRRHERVADPEELAGPRLPIRLGEHESRPLACRAGLREHHVLPLARRSQIPVPDQDVVLSRLGELPDQAPPRLQELPR
jgi:hypothetical protein